jgi:hypothetical protein
LTLQCWLLQRVGRERKNRYTTIIILLSKHFIIRWWCAIRKRHFVYGFIQCLMVSLVTKCNNLIKIWFECENECV